MSKGPGRVERAIEQAFNETKGDYFTTEELFEVVYPDAFSMERKHRVAIMRAVKTVCERTGWEIMRAEIRGNAAVFIKPTDLISYATGRKKAGMEWEWSLSRQEIRDRFTPSGSDRHLIEEGGAWFRFVQMARAKRDGDEETLSRLEAEYDADIAAMTAKFQARFGG